ncbi:MAG: hypothetical protein AAFR61_26790 [Bacteroidota bacterium]
MSQSIKPIGYFSFSGKNAGQTKSLNQLEYYGKRGEPEISSGGLIGSYLDFSGGQTGKLKLGQQVFEAFTLECWLKLPKEIPFNGVQLFASVPFGVDIRISPEMLFFQTLADQQGKGLTDQMKITLDEAGRKSYSYYNDQNWHHFVFKYDVKQGRKEIWVDGSCPKDFQRKLGRAAYITNRPGQRVPLLIHFNDVGDMGIQAAVDEIALYDRFIPAPLHQYHYELGKKGKPYTFSVPSRYVPPRPDQAAQNQQPKLSYDPREYAPGHPQVKMMPIEQLLRAPAPRYQIGHGLMRNFNWMQMSYFAGNYTLTENTRTIIKNEVALQEELALHWHYNIVLQNAGLVTRETHVIHETAKLANRYPEIPLGVITLRAQIRPTDIGIGEDDPYIRNGKLPAASYVRNARGQFLTRDGKLNSGRKQLSPVADLKALEPDAKAQAYYLESLLDELTRPIDFINENGETPFLPYPHEVMQQDPLIVKDKKKYPQLNWDEYQALKKTEQRVDYRDYLLKKIPGLRKTQFSWYGVDGGPLNLDRFSWKEARKIQSPINGMYYSTPDFYPRWPANWKKWRGPWRGWEWIEICRKAEIPLGDELFSPFVAAGWDADATQNVRPSQWLGLLKCLGNVGAEFFYVGYFNVDPKRVSDPRTYAWQAMMPAYAQAITSKYERVLRKGHLLKDAAGVPIVSVPAKDPRVLLTVRKLENQPIYIIAAGIQPISNVPGNVPDQLPMEVEIDGHKLRFEVRRQGSVYRYDLSGAQAVFAQLDAWHETGHPLYWTRDMYLDAPVADFKQEVEIRTAQRAGASEGDFYQATSYAASTGGDACIKFQIQASKGAPASYKVRVKLRNPGAAGEDITVFLDGKEIGTKSIKKEKDWIWVEMPGQVKNLGLNPHLLSVKLGATPVEVAAVQLKAN